MIWKPHVTVAAVVQRDGKYLLVEEETESGLAFNQPAGHLEEGEALVDAVVRETLEETAYDFRPTIWSASITGIIRSRASPTCASRSPANCAAIIRNAGSTTASSPPAG